MLKNCMKCFIGVSGDEFIFIVYRRIYGRYE